MQSTGTEPRIYVACLAAYNAGRLHGRWIAADDADAIAEQVAEMLKSSPVAGAEEWAIHDYEGFGSIRLSEYDSFEHVSELAAAIVEYGADVVSGYFDVTGSGADLSELPDRYAGRYDSQVDYVESYAEETGYVPYVGDGEPMPYHEDWHRAIDFDVIAHDMFMDGMSSTPADDGGVHVWHG